MICFASRLPLSAANATLRPLLSLDGVKSTNDAALGLIRSAYSLEARATDTTRG